IDLENNRGRGQKDYQVHHRIDDLESVDVVVQIVFGVAHCSDDLERHASFHLNVSSVRHRTDDLETS
ncbi:hypothetical protein QDV88_15540, partial [Acinetobacter baumannii]|uniref:hypothetical protein n=1 Tax=Acinetobacter baumannii TaxID=470 RepID=UPI002448EA5A